MDYPDYDPASPLTPLSPAELDGLDRLLQGLPADGVMTLDGMDGYLTALLTGPGQLLQVIPTREWLPLVWGGDGPLGAEEAAPFPSKRQRKSTVVLVLRHLRHVSHQVTQAAQDWEPIFSVAEKGPREYVDARDWCAGFLQAVDLLPSPWEAAWDDEQLGPQLAPLVLLGGGLEGRPAAADDEDDQADIDDPETCDALSRSVPDAVLSLAARSATLSA